jgi:hypothetical protein
VKVNGAPVIGGIPLLGAFPCPVGLAEIVKEEVMAADAKSKMAANLLSFRFIRIGDVPGSICSVSVFIFVFRFPFGVVFVFRYPVPEIRDEVPKILQEDPTF